MDEDNLSLEQWILCGDWNMTCLFDDAKGPSAFIHSLELRAWDSLVDTLDLVDNYICAGVREGPHFTRQARKIDKYNQSTLDRSYTSKRKDWCHHVKEMIYDRKKILSDHILVTYTFVLKE